MAEEDDRVHEDIQIAAMTGGAAAARTAELLLRSGQDNRRTSQASDRADDRTAQAAPVGGPPVMSDEARADAARARKAADQMNARPATEAVTAPAASTTAAAARVQQMHHQRQRGSGVSR